MEIGGGPCERKADLDVHAENANPNQRGSSARFSRQGGQPLNVADSRLPSLSIVIPVYNEQESLHSLHAELDAILRRMACHAEIIFIDDGSTDDSWSTVEGLCVQDERVSALRFRRNFGKAAALAAGFALARGGVVFTLDADLQDDPAELPRFLEKIETGYDLVSGWKRVRHDPWHKTLPSRIFNRMVSSLTGVHLHDHNCGFKCYRDEVLDEIQLYGEFHRFTPVLASAKGFRIGEIEVHHRPRRFGVSKYGWARFMKGFIDLLTVKFLTSYQHRPQHFLGSMGLACCSLGFLGMLYLMSLWCLTLWGWDYGPIGTRPLLIFSATAVLLGAQMLSMGLIAGMMAARNQHGVEVFSVAERRLSRDRLESREPAAGDT